MEAFIAWCGFFGAWLLVAGPIYQAALELSDQEISREQIASAAEHIPAPPRVSGWWWLFPPVLYLKNRRRKAAMRDAMMSTLSPEEMELWVDYINKATGWIFVGLGGALIATKETWELREHYEWHAWVFWVLIVIMTGLALANAGGRMERTRGVIEKNQQAG